MIFLQCFADGHSQDGGKDHSYSGVENGGRQLIGYGDKTCFVGKALDENGGVIVLGQIQPQFFLPA